MRDLGSRSTVCIVPRHIREEGYICTIRTHRMDAGTIHPKETDRKAALETKMLMMSL